MDNEFAKRCELCKHGSFSEGNKYGQCAANAPLISGTSVFSTCKRNECCSRFVERDTTNNSEPCRCCGDDNTKWIFTYGWVCDWCLTAIRSLIDVSPTTPTSQHLETVTNYNKNTRKRQLQIGASPTQQQNNLSVDGIALTEWFNAIQDGDFPPSYRKYAKTHNGVSDATA